MLKLLQKIAGSPESGLLASSFNTADGYENQLSATAEMINTSSAKGTAALTLKVKPSRFSCVIISTEASEGIGIFIAFTPLSESGSTVTRSWAVAVLRGQNDRPYRLLSPFGNSRQEFVTGNVSVCQTESQESLGFERGSQVGPRLRTGDFTRIWEYSYVTKKMPEQNNRPGIRRYSLIKNNSAAAPITTKETEPSKLTTKSALTDNSLNTIRSSNSRSVFSFTTNLLVQGLGAWPRRIEPCVFLPLRNLEDFVSKGPSASPPGSIFIRKTKAFNPTRFFTENNNPPSTKKVSVSAMI